MDIQIGENALAEMWAARGAAPAADVISSARRAAIFWPDSTDVWMVMGEALESIDADAAVRYWFRAAIFEPDREDLQHSLASAWIAAGHMDAARAAVLAGMARRPDRAAWQVLAARCLIETDGPTAATGPAREALRLAPHDPEIVLGATAVLRRAGEEVEAAAALQACLRREPDDEALVLALADTWIELGEHDRARAALRGADPDASAVAERLARLSAAASTLPDAFVRTLFDQYADRFDANLRGDLAYGGPELIGAVLERIVPATGDRDILDLGCGTGLAGPVLRRWARHLAGVDLSPRMVEKARERKIYDTLAVGEAVAFLATSPGAWDCVAAADVLVYIGDLAPLFGALAGALRPGGRLVATVEHLDDGTFVLQESRRFAHSARYIQESAAAAGMVVELLETASTRRDRGHPVPGLVFVLRRG